MVVKLTGDVLTITAAVSFEKLQEATKKEAVYLYDEDGNKVYGVTADSKEVANLSKAGCNFTFADAEGNASMNICVGTGRDKEWIADTFGSELTRLQAAEAKIAEAVDVVLTDRANLLAVIQ